MTKKLCNKCGVEKNTSEYRKDSHTADGLQRSCKLCRRMYDVANHASKYHEQSRARSAARRAINKAWIDQYRLDNPCEYCGETCLACLAFHHRDPAQKDFVISSNFNLNLTRIQAEIAKCAVLCHNCHAKVHAGIITL